jgi:hypothetical protein
MNAVMIKKVLQGTLFGIAFNSLAMPSRRFHALLPQLQIWHVHLSGMCTVRELRAFVSAVHFALHVSHGPTLL